MSLRFQRLILILLTLIMLGAAILLILFNTKQNIVFFYTPTELLENNIAPDKKKLRIGGYVKKSSFVKKSLNNYEFKITDNANDLVIFYKGMLPDLFREEQGIVVEGLIDKNNNIIYTVDTESRRRFKRY